MTQHYVGNGHQNENAKQGPLDKNVVAGGLLHAGDCRRSSVRGAAEADRLVGDGKPRISKSCQKDSRRQSDAARRVANRIAKGEFALDGKTYHLAINNPPNSLHGGEPGYQEVVWDTDQLNDSTIQFSYLSRDGEANYPGNLTIKVIYSLEANDSLKISYEAQTDQKTLCALTNHAYFNLNGVGSGDIYNQKVQINADRITPVDSTLIPTGELESVKGTPFDFLKLTAIGKNINEKNTQLRYCGGYDMNFVLNNPKPGSMFHAATALGDKSGILMNVYTDEPGLQFYSGNFMAGEHFIAQSVTDDYRTAFTLGTQHFPDNPHHKNFPSILLNPGQTYRSCSIYQFSVTKK